MPIRTSDPKVQAEWDRAKSLVGHRMATARRERGRTLKEVAPAMGRSLQWLNHVEHGRIMPTILDLIAIGKYLDYPFEYFLADVAGVRGPTPENPEDWYRMFPGHPELAQAHATLHSAIVLGQIRVPADQNGTN